MVKGINNTKNTVSKVRVVFLLSLKIYGDGDCDY